MKQDYDPPTGGDSEVETDQGKAVPIEQQSNS
jgi:hypothetical protein